MSRGRALGPGRLEKRGRSWVLVWADENRKRQRKTLSTDRRTAERIRSEIIHKRDMALAGLGSETGQGRTLAEIAELYLEDLKPLVSEAHFKNVNPQLRKIVAQLGAVRVRDLKTMHVVRIRNEATNAGAANRTSNLLVQRLQAMLRWADENQLIARNPIGAVKPLPYTRAEYRHKRRAMTEDEIARFLGVSEEHDERCGIVTKHCRVPQTAMWMAFLEAGTRWNELRLATWGDLDLPNGILILRAENTKSKRQREAPLRQELMDRLIWLRALHESVLKRLPNVDDRIFLSPAGCPWPRESTNARRLLDRLLNQAGIPKVNHAGEKLDIHALRTTCASRMLRSRVPLTIVQRLMGHSSPTLTAQAYTDMHVEDIRSAVESMPGLGQAGEAKAKEAR